MEDYPQDLIEFDARFATEEACRDYLMKLRWPDGFTCPKCQGHQGWTTKRNLLVCTGCQYQASLTAGTIFQGTRKPLTTWFKAIWWITTQKNGASAMGLQRILGLKTYYTAWTWLHKLRRAMVRPGRDKLSGRVEIDETFLGGLEEGVRGRKTEKKALIVIAAEEDGRGIGRIRLNRVPDASQATLHRFIHRTVEPGSTIHTDGWESYKGLDGYLHDVTALQKRKEPAHELLPRVHQVASLLKRWLLGTHQGAVSHEHLDYYLDEFTFRFNRRKSRSRGKLFYRLLQQAVALEPTPYKDLVKHIRTGPEHKG
jgi:transposase-like protein